MLFPVHGGDPRVVEVAYKLEHWNETPNIPAHRLDLSPFLGKAMPWHVTIQTDGFKKDAPPLGRSLTLIHNDNFIAENASDPRLWL